MFYQEVFRALQAAEVRYLVVGGLAVNLYGYVRMTVDMDIMVDLSEENMGRLVEVMEGLGYVPRLPVQGVALVSKQTRKEWIREKGATVFTFIDPKQPFKQVDIFLSNPLDFEQAYAQRQVITVGRTPISMISLDDLIRMKEAVGRPRDLEDVQHLHRIKQLKERRLLDEG